MEKQTQQFSSCLFECVKVRALPSTLSASRTERPISNFSFPKNMKTRRDSRASSGLSERGARFVGSLSLSLDRTYVCTQQQQQQQMDEASQTRLTVKKKREEEEKRDDKSRKPTREQEAALSSSSSSSTFLKKKKTKKKHLKDTVGNQNRRKKVGGRSSLLLAARALSTHNRLFH